MKSDLLIRHKRKQEVRLKDLLEGASEHCPALLALWCTVGMKEFLSLKVQIGLVLLKQKRESGLFIFST